MGLPARHKLLHQRDETFLMVLFLWVESRMSFFLESVPGLEREMVLLPFPRIKLSFLSRSNTRLRSQIWGT